MKIVKYLGLGILILLIGIGIYAFSIKSALTPSYRGDLKMENLKEPVDVYFTKHGVPHIYADNDLDAYRALGYIHAMDRLWQMDLLRHVGSGRLSELFGEVTIENDKFFRGMGFNSYAKASAAAYRERNHASKPFVDAYLAGINEYIANNPKPLEYRILGLDIEPFQLENIYEILVYMSFSFNIGHTVDPLLTELYQKLDSTYFKDLKLYHYEGQNTLRSYDARFSQHTQTTLNVLENMKVPVFSGSNSWILGPEKSTSSKVVMMNDPHIGYAQPSIYYETHITTPNMETYGHYIVGMPFPFIFHNESHAVGLTMFMNDDNDFYVEEIHTDDSDKYRHKGEWKTMEIQKEVINVKGGDPVNFEIKSTVHGPIISNLIPDNPIEEVVAIHWSATQHTNYLIESIFGFGKAKDVYEMEKAVSLIHGPGLNIMYGDNRGNIAWWAAAKLPVRRSEQASKTFLDGASGADDLTEYYDFKSNPHAINPPWHFVHSANNQPDTVNGVLYSGYYAPDHRSKRIEGVLNSKADFSVDDMKEMLLDNKLVGFEKIKTTFLNALPDDVDDELVAALNRWEGNLNKDDAIPLIFERWIHETMELTQKDEIGDDLWPIYIKAFLYDRAKEHIIENETSVWWDNVQTPEKETRFQLIQQGFQKAMSTLETNWGPEWQKWKWGDAHQMLHKHALGDALGFLNVGPFPASGGNDVINNMGYIYDSEAKVQNVIFGPAARRIIDFSNIRDNSWNIHPTGQSGNYFSEFYDDQAELYAQGGFRKMEMNHDKIKASKKKMSFKP